MPPRSAAVQNALRRRRQVVAAGAEPPQAGVVFVTNEIPNVIAGLDYNFQIVAYSVYNGPGGQTQSGLPLLYQLDLGELPDGIILTENGLLTGNSTDIETFNVRIRAYIDPSYLNQNEEGEPAVVLPATHDYEIVCAANAYELENPVSIITTSPLPNGIVGQTYSLQLQAGGGVAGIEWSVTVGSLPAGLTLQLNGQLVGTPTAPGAETFTVEATDGSTSDTLACSLSILAEPLILPDPGAIIITTQSPLPSGVVGMSYTPVHLQYTGSSLPVVWSIVSGAFPTGLTMSGNGFITGIPTASGPFTVTLRASDGVAFDGTKLFVMTVLGATAGVVVTAPAAGGSYGAGTAVALGWTCANQPASPAWEVQAYTGSLPAGVITTTTPVEGSPGVWTATTTLPASLPAATNYGVRITETTTGGFGQAGPFTVTAYPAIAITTSGALTSAAVSVLMTPVQFVATGGIGTLTWTKSAGTLPTGVTLSSSGLLSGTPAAAGPYTFTVTASDGIGPPASVACSLAVTQSTVIVITSGSPLPAATLNAVYTPVQLTQTGGTTPTWSVTVGSLPTGLSLSSGGLLSGTPTVLGTSTFTVSAVEAAHTTGTKVFALSVLPVLAPGTQQIAFRDGTILTVGEGCAATILNGATGGASTSVSPFYTLSQTLDLAAKSAPPAGTLIAGNAPNGCPLGLKVTMTAGHFEMQNLSRGYISGQPLGCPVYFQTVDANIPGRIVMFGEEYCGATHVGDAWSLVKPTTPKHPARSNVSNVAGGPYEPSKSIHMLDGGESMYWRFLPSADPHEALPSALTIANALTVVEVDETRIAAWPFLGYLMDLSQHDAANYTNVNLPAQQVRMTALTRIEFMHAHHPGPATNLNPNPYKTWYTGLYTISPEDGASQNLRPGWYYSILFYGLYVCRHPAASNAQGTYEYFLGLLRTFCRTAINRTDAAGIYKGMQCDEGATSFTYNGTILFARMGTGGAAGGIPFYGKTWDTALVLGELLTEGNDPLIHDAWERRLVQLENENSPFTGNSGGNASGPSTGTRGAAHVMESWWLFRKVCLLKGGSYTARAATLKTKASTYLGKIWTAVDQSATCTAALGVATKTKWVPITQTPTVTPITTGALGGNTEGMFKWITRWMVDEALHPTRLAEWKDMVSWWYTNNVRFIGNGMAEAAYRMYPDMSGGGATWNNTPIQVFNSPGNANNSYNNYPHQIEEMPIFAYLSSWFPGAVAPGGLTWLQLYDQLCKMAYADPSVKFPGMSSSPTGVTGASNSGNGALNYNIWPQKHTGLFCQGYTL